MAFVRAAAVVARTIRSNVYYGLHERSFSSMTRPLEGQIALVTGASRGIGRGIALQLGQAGATVYITGRSPEKSLASEVSNLPSLEKTAQDIRDRGGECIPVYCDHSSTEDIERLFERIQGENEGVLDILVNNAFAGVKAMGDSGGKKFYELDPSLWDAVNNVGLRSHYIASVFAARMMVKRNSGLIVNISSAGGLQYTFNAAYGIGKCGLDRMAADLAMELKPSNVTIVSLWPGMVRTEMTEQAMQDTDRLLKMVQKPKEIIEKGYRQSETIEFPGKAIVALASDRNVNKKSGRILMTYDLAKEYGFKDIDGKMPMDMRNLSSALEYLGWPTLAKFTPGCMRIPLFAMHFASYKF